MFGTTQRAMLCFAILAHLTVAATASSSSSTTILSSPYIFDPSQIQNSPPLSLRRSFVGSVRKIIETKWTNAYQLALIEQAVEDFNAEIVATSSTSADSVSYRRLIALPLDERFDPPTGVFSHGHVQTGDKMSLPKNFWTAIVKKGAEVPWLFEVSRVDGVTGERAIFTSAAGAETTTDPNLQRVVGGAIDFRAPANYVFLPRWMMHALALRPRDVVDVKLIETVPPGSAVRLRPHSSEFVSIANHQAVLETELKHYSALTKGSTIAFDYNDKRYYFDVVDLRSAPRGEKTPLAKVQDCDIAAEFTRPKDDLSSKKKRKKQEEEEEQNE